MHLWRFLVPVLAAVVAAAAASVGAKSWSVLCRQSAFSPATYNKSALVSVKKKYDRCVTYKSQSWRTNNCSSCFWNPIHSRHIFNISPLRFFFWNSAIDQKWCPYCECENGMTFTTVWQKRRNQFILFRLGRTHAPTIHDCLMMGFLPN